MAPERAGWVRGASGEVEETVVEDVVVRQYRYLLTTATVDALEGIHAEVLRDLSEAERSRLLRALSGAFATGLHVAVGEDAKIAHLVATGAHRAPYAWLESLDPPFARQLAEAAVVAESSYGRLNGYVYWDGSSPTPVEEAGPNDGFNLNVNRYRVERDPSFYRLRGYPGP